jgi:hypothetical protein
MLTLALAVVLVPRTVIPAVPVALPGPAVPIHSPVKLPGLALPTNVRLSTVLPAPVRAPVPAIKQLKEMVKQGQADADSIRVVIEGSKSITLPEDDLLTEIGIVR